jgi:hypothetical protein
MAQVSDVPLLSSMQLKTTLGRSLTSFTLIPGGSLGRNRALKCRSLCWRTKKKVARTDETARREMNDTAMTDHAVFSNAGMM